MIEWIVSSSILIAAVLLLRLIFQGKISKRLQYAVWGLVVLRLLIPGSIAQSAASVGNLLSGLMEKPIVQAASGTLFDEQSYYFALNEVLSEHDILEDNYTALPLDQQEIIIQAYQPQIQLKLDSYEKAHDTAQILKALWLTGCALMGLLLLTSNLCFYLRLRRTRESLNISASLPVYQTPAVQTPSLLGLMRPSVYLPDAAVDEESMAYILAHEQTHCRHGDHIWALARCVCLALHWYNPLVWIAVKVSRVDCELACDEGTLAKLGDGSRENYGRILIEMSRTTPSVQDYLLTATTMTSDKKSLYQRIQAIATGPKCIISAVITLVLVSLMIVGCTFTGAAHPTEPTPEATAPTTPDTTMPPPTTLPPKTTVPTETQAPTFPMGTMGNNTNGALRGLTLDMGVYCETYPFGENVLLCIPQEGRYQIRSLEDGRVLADVTDSNLANTVTVTDHQIIYYSLMSRKITFRDLNLQVVKTVDVSAADNISTMLFSQDGTSAYYCKDQYTVVKLNIETGEERVIPVSGPQIWSMSGLYFDDTVLSYWGKENGENYYAFVNLETGAYLGKDTALSRFRQWDNGYYLCRAQMGNVEHQIVQDGAYQYMTPKEHGYGTRLFDAWVLPQLNCFLTMHYNYEGFVMKLDLYDLNTLQRISSLSEFLKFASSASVFADASGEYIWLSLKTGAFPDYQMVLYRWDYKANAVEDATIYGHGG